jgi:hypothetical protein
MLSNFRQSCRWARGRVTRSGWLPTSGSRVVLGAAERGKLCVQHRAFGCGRPNVFQGRIGTSFNPGQFNAVTFNGVPIDPPGTGTSGSLRFTNVRAKTQGSFPTRDTSKP